jgi:Chs5-Arf1p-binding protein BUD7/BCH1
MDSGAPQHVGLFIGWQLGSKPEIQVATSTNNHLTNAIMKYFGDSFRYGPAITLFEKHILFDAGDTSAFRT